MWMGRCRETSPIPIGSNQRFAPATCQYAGFTTIIRRPWAYISGRRAGRTRSIAWGQFSLARGLESE
jgi:hypothetical protein